MFALLDGNNFYASCERVFRPDLARRPLVVLSNNDGCAIARSDEAKALGIAMGQPWFQIRHLQQQAGLVALSANFTLYGDFSDRMMSLAAELGHSQEVYSIDECFIGLDGSASQRIAEAQALRARIRDWIGIPTCIGIGPTKTLAKLANHIAKSAERKPGSYPAAHAGVCDLGALDAAARDALLAATPVGAVWGVGRRLQASLHDAGIANALQLAQLDAGAVQRRWSVVLARTVRELQGHGCLDLEQAPAPRQQIACTRSFGQTVGSVDALAQAVSHFTARAAEKLRRQRSLAAQVLVFIRTSPFRTREPQYSNAALRPLPRPSSDTATLTRAALAALQTIYRPGYRYAKAGVLLLELGSAAAVQLDLGLDPGTDAPAEPSERPQLMRTLDQLNRRYGAGTLQLASCGAAHQARRWSMQQNRRTPRYTTAWDELAVTR